MLSVRFTAALLTAAELHAGHVRKGSGVPYLAHLLSVAALALEHGADEDTAIAALFHDAIEDQAQTFAGGAEALRAMLADRFGEHVVAIVDACTDAESFPKPPWRARKEAYLASVPQKSEDALLVSAADKVHNARSILRDYRQLGDELWTRFRGGKEGTLWYYRALVDAFHQAPQAPPALVYELNQIVSQIETLATR